MTSRQSRGLGWTGALGLLVLAAALDLVLAAVTPDAGTGVWWSVVGIHVGLLTLAPARWWPAPGSRRGRGHRRRRCWPRGTRSAAAAVDGVGTLAMAARGALVLRSGPGRLQLHSPGDLGRLMVAAASVGLIGVAADMAVTGVLGELQVPSIVVLTGVLSAHALSVLALVPLVLLAGRVRRQGPLWLLAVQVAVLAGTTYVSLAAEAAVPLTFLPVAALVWGAYAFDLATSAAELAVFTAVVIVVSARGTGPFGTLLADGTLDPRRRRRVHPGLRARRRPGHAPPGHRRPPAGTAPGQAERRRGAAAPQLRARAGRDADARRRPGRPARHRPQRRRRPDLRRPPRPAGRTAAARPGPPRRPAPAEHRRPARQRAGVARPRHGGGPPHQPRRPGALHLRGTRRGARLLRPAARRDPGAGGDPPGLHRPAAGRGDDRHGRLRHPRHRPPGRGDARQRRDPRDHRLRPREPGREGDLGHPRLAVHPSRPRGPAPVAQPLRPPGRAREHDLGPRRPSAAADLEQQRGAVRLRPAVVLRGDRGRRHRRARQHRAGHPPDAGLGEHGADRHRHRGPDHGVQLRGRAPAGPLGGRGVGASAGRLPRPRGGTPARGVEARTRGPATRPPPSWPSSSGWPTAPSHPRSTGPGSPPRAPGAWCR